MDFPFGWQEYLKNTSKPAIFYSWYTFPWPNNVFGMLSQQQYRSMFGFRPLPLSVMCVTWARLHISAFYFSFAKGDSRTRNNPKHAYQVEKQQMLNNVFEIDIQICWIQNSGSTKSGHNESHSYTFILEKYLDGNRHHRSIFQLKIPLARFKCPVHEVCSVEIIREEMSHAKYSRRCSSEK